MGSNLHGIQFPHSTMHFFSFKLLALAAACASGVTGFTQEQGLLVHQMAILNLENGTTFSSRTYSTDEATSMVDNWKETYHNGYLRLAREHYNVVDTQVLKERVGQNYPLDIVNPDEVAQAIVEGIHSDAFKKELGINR